MNDPLHSSIACRRADNVIKQGSSLGTIQLADESGDRLNQGKGDSCKDYSSYFASRKAWPVLQRGGGEGENLWCRTRRYNNENLEINKDCGKRQSVLENTLKKMWETVGHSLKSTPRKTKMKNLP